MEKLYINANSKNVGSAILFAAPNGKLFLDGNLTQAADAKTVRDLFLAGTLCIAPGGSDLIRVSAYHYNDETDVVTVTGVSIVGVASTFHTGESVTNGDDDEAHT